MWTPELDREQGPLYRSLAEALAQDIDHGRLKPGERLPTHRDLARALGVTVGTVTRAYHEAARRGLVGGEVGRGTFVRGEGFLLLRGPSDGLIDLSLNFPPTTGLEEILPEALSRLARKTDLLSLGEYDTQTGAYAHREAAAQFLASRGLEVLPERVLITGGGQHGMTVVAATLTQPGDLVLTESLTYPGMKALASLLHLRLGGVPMDELGLLPDALEAAIRSSGAKLLYCQPTLHNPATRTMSLERREQIAEVARRSGISILEDDSYGFLPPDAPPPLATFAPERTYYVSSTSKSILPGLRIGFLAGPPAMLERLTSSLWAVSWMSSPMMAEVVSDWIQRGVVSTIIEARRREARVRQAAAARHFTGLRYDTHPSSYHLWLHLPEPWRSGDFVEQARARGVAVTPADVFAAGRDEAPHAVRVCLGAVRGHAQLEEGLAAVAEILRGAPEPCCRTYV